jgi:hypothetical protein
MAEDFRGIRSVGLKLVEIVAGELPGVRVVARELHF